MIIRSLSPCRSPKPWFRSMRTPTLAITMSLMTRKLTLTVVASVPQPVSMGSPALSMVIVRPTTAATTSVRMERVRCLISPSTFIVLDTISNNKIYLILSIIGVILIIFVILFFVLMAVKKCRVCASYSVHGLEQSPCGFQCSYRRGHLRLRHVRSSCDLYRSFLSFSILQTWRSS